MTRRSRRPRRLALLAGPAGLALALAGCSTGGGDDVPTPSGTSKPTTITWGYDQEWDSYNTATTEGATTANMVVVNGVLSGFWQFNPDGSLRRVPDFGTYVRTDDDPLTVKYTINPKARWSDGEPIDCDDMVLTWLARSGITGEKGFSSSSTVGYRDMNIPQCKAGDRTVTITYKRSFADWDSMFGPGEILPAHVVEARGGLNKSFIDIARTPRSPALAKAIAFYNTGWNLRPGRLEKDVMPSSGPYLVDSWTPGQSLTLKANPRWWGRAPATATVVIRYLAATAQVQALANGEIQVMDPQAQVDLITQLRTLGDKVSYRTADSYSFEHLDFNLKGQFRDRSLREAFALCVPRQQIVDNLVKPQNAAASVQQSRFVYPFQPSYAQVVAGLRGRSYDRVDIAKAKQLLAGRTPTVRIGWRKDPAQPNKRRADTIALVAASCKAAGITVVDAGTPTFLSMEWLTGAFDVALFAWTGSPLITATDGIYTTDGGNNPYGYSNPSVDRLTDQLARTIDKGRQLQLLTQLDGYLWADVATIPLFALPAVLATTRDVRGQVYNATSADLTWNVADWTRS